MQDMPWLEPVLNTEEMRALDTWAIEDQGVPALELMEMAGAAVAETASEVAVVGPVVIVCGKGNNGGDGLVAARHLRQAGHEVRVVCLWAEAELSGDAKANAVRLEVAIEDPADLDAMLEGAGAVVDAIFGTGFSGEPRSPAAEAIDSINRSGAPVIACDIASGVDAANGEAAEVSVEATVTVSFHAAKLGHVIAPGKTRTGELRIAPIGIPGGAPIEPAAGVITERVLHLPPMRAPGGTKFASGRLAAVGGSAGMTGALCLTAEAAIRSGAGYVSVCVPEGLEPIIEVKLTEVMSIACPGPARHHSPEALDLILDSCRDSAAVILGPGFGRIEDALELARTLAPLVEAPLLIDADGLNAHAADGDDCSALEALSARREATVLTPHAGELGRLLGVESAEVSAHRLELARRAAQKARAIVVLKGDDTIVTDGQRLAVNALSAPALATAGTGDVLSGVIGALIARGLDPFAAACAGVFGHARAGVLAAERIGSREGVIAGDVVAALPSALAPTDI